MRPNGRHTALLALAIVAAACVRPPSGPGATASVPRGSDSAPTHSAPGPAATSSSPPTNALNAAAATLLPTDRFALPTFDLSRFRTLLDQLRGVPVVVNIWASWCGPCRLEAPILAKAARQFGRRVQFLGIDILDQLGPARSFIRGEGWPYPSLFDPTGAIRAGLGFVGQPDTVFFDREGSQVSFTAGGTTYRAWQGPITMAALRSILTQLLARS